MNPLSRFATRQPDTATTEQKQGSDSENTTECHGRNPERAARSRRCGGSGGCQTTRARHQHLIIDPPRIESTSAPAKCRIRRSRPMMLAARLTDDGSATFQRGSDLLKTGGFGQSRLASAPPSGNAVAGQGGPLLFRRVGKWGIIRPGGTLPV